MKNLPKIEIIKDNLDEEVKVFYKFLHSSYSPQNRNKILRAFPDLQLKIEKSASKEDEKEILRQFIVAFYKKNKKVINQIIKDSEVLIGEKSKEALRELAKRMDYEWPKKTSYKAVPTILPFSPFKGDVFNFSILHTIQNEEKRKRSALFVAIHEISHFVFFDILNKILKKHKIDDFHEDTKNYFKETLTAVLLNQKDLCEILELSNYKGNAEIHGIQIREKGEVLTFYDFVLREYNKVKTEEGQLFETFLIKMLKTLQPLASEFSKKRKLWNKYGTQTYRDQKLLKKYVEPIEIKK